MGFGTVDRSSQGNAVSFDAAGNILLTGEFEDNVDLGGGMLLAAGGDDIFVAKFDASGAHLWSQGIGGTSLDIGHDIGADITGNVFVTGRFASTTVDFGGGPIAG